MASAVLATVRRGGIVESVHAGSLVVCDPEGALVFALGDAEAAAFPRSAIKAMQALPLVVSGAAERARLTDEELALACASHSGTPAHTAVAEAMLRKAGRDVACLECGVHWPSSPSAARALAAAGRSATALHNNCSGKHAGFVCTAVAAGREPRGYIQPDHPTMQAVTGAVAAVTGAALGPANRGVDGCSIPTFVTPLRALARGFARFGTGRHLPEGFAQAAARLRRAVAAHPGMVAGEGRFDTEITAALGEAAFVKTGAEGVHAGALPGLGLGFAVKVADGANRAADAVTAGLLHQFLGENDVLRRWMRQTLVNWNGMAVGEIESALQ